MTRRGRQGGAAKIGWALLALVAVVVFALARSGGTPPRLADGSRVEAPRAGARAGRGGSASRDRAREGTDGLDTSQPFGAHVTRVSDGDTLEVVTHSDGREVRVRLQGVDCPESQQAFGGEATAFVKRWVADAQDRVWLVPETVDRYGRLVAQVRAGGSESGERLGVALVGAGLAWHYVRYSDDAALAAAERAARASSRGLWSDGDAIAPWDFRKSRRKGKR